MADEILNASKAADCVREELLKARSVKVVVPFVTSAGAELLIDELKKVSPRKTVRLVLLTRFDPESILAGVCDLEALKMLLALQSSKISVEIRRLDSLHAKFYIFDERAVIIGSSNLTQAAQTINVELNVYSRHRTYVDTALAEFTRCWAVATPVDTDWINRQEKALEPFQKRYQALCSELRSLTILQSIRMPDAEKDFLASLKRILKKAGSAKGMTKTWLEQEMQAASRRNLDVEQKLNVDRRISFLKILDLIHEKDGIFSRTPLGTECYNNNKKLFEGMIVAFPILVTSFNAVPKSGQCTCKQIAHVDCDSRIPTEPSQTLRNALHWLASFGLLEETLEGSTYKFQRKRSSLSSLITSSI